MLEYEYSLTHIFPYIDRIFDSVLIRENTGQKTRYCSIHFAVKTQVFKLCHTTSAISSGGSHLFFQLALFEISR